MNPFVCLLHRAGLALASAALLLPACAAEPIGPEEGPDDPAALARAQAPLPVGRPVFADDAAAAAAQVLGARANLRLSSVRQSLTGEHVRYQQLAPDGTEVVDAEVSVHFSGAAPAYRVARVFDRPAAPRLSGQRSVPEAAVTSAALAAVRAHDATSATYALAALVPAALAAPENAAELRAGYRVRVATTRPVHLWDVWVDGESGTATVRRDLVWHADGTALVYRPNPVTSTGNLALTDADDATSAALDAARVAVTLPRLDGSGDLRGEYANVTNKGGSRVNVGAGLDFAFDRFADGFEEVNAYFHVDAAQHALQGLGFTGAKAILGVPFTVIVNAIEDDNSFYSPGDRRIEMGTGGVDDAEDGDIVIHEYGHATQDNIIPGFGTGEDGGALGEGFGDILAASVPTGVPALVDRACVGSWDATAYSNENPPCLRRVDGQRHYPEFAVGQVHADGELWSGAMWAMYEATGLGPELGLQLVIEAFFMVPASVSFTQYAEALIAADTALHAGAHVDAIKRTLWRHGFLRELAPPGELVGSVQSVTTTLAQSQLGDFVDQEMAITQAGAGAIRLHFASFDMESATSCVDGHCDSVYLYDGEGRLYAKLGGALGAFDAPVVPGDTVVVRWVTDVNTTSVGFAIDRYDWVVGGDDEDDDDGGGCGCRAGGANDSGVERNVGALALLAIAGLVLMTRRLRRRAA